MGELSVGICQWGTVSGELSVGNCRWGKCQWGTVSGENDVEPSIDGYLFERRKVRLGEE